MSRLFGTHSLRLTFSLKGDNKMETIVKECRTCKQVKDNSLYDKKKGGKYGTRTECKTCRVIRRKESAESRAVYDKEYRKRNADEVKKRKRLYYEKNKERLLEKSKQYHKDTAEQRKKYHAYYRDANREELNRKRNIRRNKKFETDPAFKLKYRVASSIHQALKKQGHRKDAPTWKALPYTPQQLKEHIEAQFEDWMTWDNHGTWHIDHIYPQSRLPYDSLKHPNFQKCWALENLRPLCAIENMRKSDKIV